MSRGIRFGAVDLGSNSFRTEIGELRNGRLVSSTVLRSTVRLAGGLDQRGCLTPAIRRAALAALRASARRLSGIPPERVRAVGTQAWRLAHDAELFRPLAETALGHRIDIISGREEAQLIFLGCAHLLPHSPERRLVIDVGGASTEVIVGRGWLVSDLESFPVGCVNASARFFPDGQVSAAAFRAAARWAGAAFAPWRERLGRDQWDVAYGSAGTCGAISAIGLATGWSETEAVTLPLLLRLRRELIAGGDIGRLALPGLSKDRRPVIAGGTAVLLATCRAFGARWITPCSGALRLGLLHQLWQRHRGPEGRP